jgi:uncharacterized RDD family membrane protein YckC
MLVPLDLSSRFSGLAAFSGDVISYRPLLYGTLFPMDFLLRSVDEARLAESPDLANPLSPVHWLVEARDLFSSSQSVEQALPVVRRGLERALECSLSPRERLQLWYCLRSLGVVPPGSVSTQLLGVAFEFPQPSGALGILAVYSDRSALAMWKDGVRRWPAYEDGAAALMVQDLIRLASRTPLDVVPLEDLPALAPPGAVRLIYMTPGGLRVCEFDPFSLAGQPLADVYNSGVTLFGLLLDDPAAPQVSPPMDLADPQWQYPPFSSRAGAFLADLLLFGFFLAAVFYFSREALAGWSVSALLVLCVLTGCLPPLLSAWMESSSAWGFRTPGKHLFALTVYSVEDSLGPRFVQALARNFSKYFLSSLFLFCGFLWAFFHTYGRTWHDLFADTVVVGAPAFSDEEDPDGDSS